MYCRKCKRDLPDDAKFCCFCGVLLQPPPQKPKSRANGTGTAIKRGRTWEARVVAGWKTEHNHKIPIRRSKGGFKTKTEALNYCATLLAENGLAKRKTPTLIDYFEIYEKHDFQHLSASKQTAYRIAWKKLEPIHHRKIDSLTIAELRDIVSKTCPSYYTARDCKILLNHLYELAGAENWVSKDIPSYIILPELKEKERQAFTVEEQTALWHSYESGDRNAAIPLLMISTGMMPGEMQNLKVENIHLDKRQILGIGMKTKVRKESPVFLPDDVLPVLEDLIVNAQPSGYIFIHNEDTWYASYYSALENARVRRLEPYCCRHTTATRLAITESIAPQTIQRAMRWSSTKMLDRYAHPDHTDVLAAVNTITSSEGTLENSR